MIGTVLGLNLFKIDYGVITSRFYFKVSGRQQKDKLQVYAKKPVVRDQAESSSF